LQPITRREWAAVAAWACALASVPAALLWHGYSLATEGSVYTGYLGPYPNDYHGYLAWIRQALDGRLLFRNLYTTEPHAGVFFHPLFWGIGAAARVTGLPVMLVWYAVHLVGYGLMVAAIYRFCSLFTDRRGTRRLALVLATTASGVGWLADPGAGTHHLQRPIDVWMAEANAFQPLITSFFTLPAALALLLMSMTHAIRHLRGSGMRDALLAGVYALALAAVHPYDLVTLLSVLAVWTLLAGRRYYRGMLLAAAIPVPYVLYGLAVVGLSPVFSRMDWSMPSATPWAHATGWGLPLVLCVTALLLPRVWARNREVRYLAAWLAVNLALIWLPLSFQRRMLWGVHVVISLLAAMALAALLEGATRRIRSRPRRAALCAALALGTAGLSAIGSGRLVAVQVERQRSLAFGDYLPDGVVEGLRWLAAHRDGAESVVAPLPISALVPGRSGMTVFGGHWAQTIDLRDKQRFVRSLFRAPESLGTERVRRVLARNRVRYVVLGAEGDPQGRTRAGLSSSPLLRQVLHNDALTIWEYRDYRSASPTEPWESGDWRGEGGSSAGQAPQAFGDAAIEASRGAACDGPAAS
jgi:hypothetical protein